MHLIHHRSRTSLAIGLLIFFTSTASRAEAEPPPAAEELSCLLASNCVNSLDDLTSLPPLEFSGSASEAHARLMATLAAFPEARIVSDTPLRVETIFTTTVGFRDTVIFRIDAARQRIDFRSGSNFGLYDFGKNRSRMKDVTLQFAKTPG